MYTTSEHHGEAPDPAQIVDVDELVWHDPASTTLDIARTSVARLTISGIHAPLTLRMPTDLKQISLAGELGSVLVDGAPRSVDLVQLWGDVSAGLPEWCLDAEHLEISDTASLDLMPLTRAVRLRELTVRNVPGRISGCSAVAAPPKLGRINFMCCYDIETTTLPAHHQIPNLTWMSFDGVSAADARVLRSRVEGFWNGHVRHARSPRWLAEHIDDPFRTWSDEDPELGCRATASWNRTRSRLAVATSPQVKEAVLRDLIRALDGLSREYLFDTLRREQAGEAVRTLVEANLGETHPLSEWTPE
ncbi:hypothetical protein ACMT9U_03375 [Clavibacter sp. Sh2036]|uniref:hypothetical protein n=1 Tax=unclassified Clavibacter TaxID=2626594 RepID=UPI0022EAAB40|nr:hypothetical protein [Clavibacter sp. CT19]MDA3804454.1 hypothetical protein [Clavibacter sp. CT19]